MTKVIPTRVEQAVAGDGLHTAASHALQGHEKLVASRARRLRHIVVRGLTAGFLMTLALGGFVVWQRDTARMNEAVNRIQPYFETFRQEVSRIGMLPLSFPGGKVGKAAWSDHLTYPSPEAIVQLRKHPGPVLVAYANSGPRLYLHAHGRPVVLCEGKKVTLRWASDSEWVTLREAQDRFVADQLNSLRQTAPNLP